MHVSLKKIFREKAKMKVILMQCVGSSDKNSTAPPAALEHFIRVHSEV